METMNHYNGVINIVDLEARECNTEDLSEDLIAKALGGAAINLELYEQYKDRDPLILGSGFFTATFMPLACCGVATAKSPVTGAIGHVPFGWQTGVELKLTGFDFVVILGKAENPVRLWLHDGLADIDEASDIWGKDVWASTDKIREAYGDSMIQMLLIGKAGEHKVPVSQLSENYWGSKDTFGFGAVFGRKNLKAVAMRGLGSLEVAKGFFQKCVQLKNEIIGGTIKGRAGLADVAADLGMDAAIAQKIKSMTHRNVAGYNCTYPYYSFLKYREAPSAMAMGGSAEPGCLVSNLLGFASLHNAGFEAPQAMEKCYRLGLDPAAAGQLAKQQGITDMAEFDQIAADGKAPSSLAWPIAGGYAAAIAQATDAFSNALPPRMIFAKGQDSAEWWLKRQAIAYTLGLDPMIMLMTPEITDEKLVDLIRLSAEWDEFCLDDLQRIAAGVIGKKA
jgi:aldehyde:ferredoxin oxidoreductase